MAMVIVEPENLLRMMVSLWLAVGLRQRVPPMNSGSRFRSRLNAGDGTIGAAGANLAAKDAKAVRQ
jgi:hypothetical protein